ncbi:hypothetical protein LTSEMIS_2905 [Salmonella enterica subsp. enterica serovar Mississippi str. A4-633]|nr:hypothetical protein LTSEMIS_2905 [Salmonella enterica subsp. enterica serovar Mississippi str. A4-633]
MNQAEFIQMKRLIVYSKQHGTLSSVSIDNYYHSSVSIDNYLIIIIN